MTKIAICICTRKRQDELLQLLQSIEEMNQVDDIDIHVVIVENDLKKYSQNTVSKFAEKSKYKISYHLETRRGISYARNRSVREAEDCEFCCFVDDDQIVDPDWLKELIKCQREFDSDGVYGVTPPRFERPVPPYVQQFYRKNNSSSYGSITDVAATGCLLLKKHIMDTITGPFDLRLNFTGGEDVFLTHKVTQSGGIIRNNPYAIAYELIPDERTTLKYILKRKFRNANTAYFLRSLMDPNFRKYKILYNLFLSLGYGLIIVFPYLVFRNFRKLKGVLNLVYVLGGFAFIFGKKNEFYSQ